MSVHNYNHSFEIYKFNTISYVPTSTFIGFFKNLFWTFKVSIIMYIFLHISQPNIFSIFFLGPKLQNIAYDFMLNKKYYHMSGINTANSDTSRDVTFFSAILKSPISRGASLHGVTEAWLINILVWNFIGKLSNTCRLNAYFFVKIWIS